jgi:hypothetical protein
MFRTSTSFCLESSNVKWGFDVVVWYSPREGGQRKGRVPFKKKKGQRAKAAVEYLEGRESGHCFLSLLFV